MGKGRAGEASPSASVSRSALSSSAPEVAEKGAGSSALRCRGRHSVLSPAPQGAPRQLRGGYPTFPVRAEQPPRRCLLTPGEGGPRTHTRALCPALPGQQGSRLTLPPALWVPQSSAVGTVHGALRQGTAAHSQADGTIPMPWQAGHLLPPIQKGTILLQAQTWQSDFPPACSYSQACFAPTVFHNQRSEFSV